MGKRSWKIQLSRYLNKQLKKYKRAKHIKLTKEFSLLVFFGFLFFVLVLRLFYLQVVKYNDYEDRLSDQHVSSSLLEADRGHIYVTDKSGKPQQLTENLTMYNVFVDPKFIGDKQRFIELITPAVYQHFCVSNGIEKIDTQTCIENVERFAVKDLLPEEPQFFYYGSGKVTPERYSYDWTGYQEQMQQILTGFSSGAAYQLISQRLDDRIEIGVKTRNYIGFFANPEFITDLEALNLSYVTILYDNYVYVEPAKVSSPSDDIVPLQKLLDQYGQLDDFPNLEQKFYPQENRYVRLLTDVTPQVAQTFKDLKTQYYSERTAGNIPILHGLGLEPYTVRYYPYGRFMAHVLGFTNDNGQSFYGIEQYFDDLLAGDDGKIAGRASAWIGQVGANEFDVQDVVHGSDVYLTIDPGMQKEVEAIATKYHEELAADSVSVLVYDPYNGHVKASVTAPAYNPNNFDDVFAMKPLAPSEAYIVDDDTHVDVPIYIKTGGDYRLATTDERFSTGTQKYIAQNKYGPQVFVDKNISMAYEPGSIFKAFTIGIGFDMDEIRLFDFYNDPGKVKVGIYEIANIEEKCTGQHTFLHALVRSCNVGMVRIAQRINKYSFYNYLQKLGFGQMTNIELANEDPGYVEGVTTVSVARFLNNTYGQGLLATPIQLAAAYGALVNGGYYVKPTVVQGIHDTPTDTYRSNPPKIVRQIFKEDTAEAIKNALFEVIEQNEGLTKQVKLEGFTLGGKSGTSQIAFKGKYQEGEGRTNASFIGLVTKEFPKYVVIVQARRPRTAQRGGQTAGKVFNEVAKFLISYDLIEQ